MMITRVPPPIAMQLSVQSLALSFALVFTAASAIPVEDWKASVGWDGTVLPVSSIGSVVSNDTHGLEVHFTPRR